MPDTVIENPILNSPYREPGGHFRFGAEGITNEIVEGRQLSSYFVPIPPPKKKGKQLQFETEWTKDQIEENETVNRIRQRVGTWRSGEYQGVTHSTRRLLQHWTDPERENKLFFCQIEAVETLIYLTEATARTLWVPAVNNHSGFGRWAFLEITDPYDDVAELIRSLISRRAEPAEARP